MPVPRTPRPARPPRRVPSGAKSVRRVREILDASRAVFADRGYEAATMTEIAERLGVSEATIFTYFSGKRALCLRVVEDWYDEIIARVDDGMPRKQSIRAQLAYTVRAHLHLFLVQGTGLCALVLSEGRAKGQPLGDQLVPLQRRYTAPLMALLARGRASGEIRDDVPLRLLRSLVYGPMEHILWEAVGARKPIDIDAAADGLLALLWPMLQPPRAELAALRKLRTRIAAIVDEPVVR